MRLKKNASIPTLESQRTSLLLYEDSLREILRDRSLSAGTKDKTRHELKLCQKKIAELTQQIASFRAKLQQIRLNSVLDKISNETSRAGR